MGLNPVKLGFQLAPWIAGGVVVMEGYALVTNTNTILPDFGLHNWLKGLTDPFTNWVNGILHPSGVPGGATCGGKVCPAGQHLNTATCNCDSDTGCGAKTCPLGQHLDAACVCVTDQVCNGLVCVAGQHLDPTCHCVPNTVPAPGGTLQNGYVGAMEFYMPKQGLRWPSNTMRVLVNTTEAFTKSGDISAVTLILDNQPMPMTRSSGSTWELQVPLNTGNHVVRAISTYKNGWTTAAPTTTFTVL